jgi:hypothetical protein
MDWLEIASKVFEIAVFPLIGAGVAYFIAWIKAKKLELEKKVKNETTKEYLDMLEKTIIDCVLATKQTYVDTLKKEGIFTAEAQKTAFQRTYDAVMAIITDDAQKYLTEAVKDLETYITNKIEAQVIALK